MSEPILISDKMLEILIRELLAYKARGVVDPWILSDGTTVEPVDALIELQEWRKGVRKI